MRQHKLLSFLPFICLGILLIFIFSPFHAWYLAPIIFAIILFKLDSTSLTKIFYRSLCFGFGFWLIEALLLKVVCVYLYHSSGFVTFIAVAFIWFLFSIFTVMAFITYASLRTKNVFWNYLLLFPACWTLCEYLRAKLFPFLIIGISSIDSPFKNLIPYLGSFGMSFLMVSLGGALALLFKSVGWMSAARGIIRQPVDQKLCNAHPLRLIGLFWILFWVALSMTVSHMQWIKPVGQPISVALVQGNIDYQQEESIRVIDEFLKYAKLSASALYAETPLIIWPESSLTANIHFIPKIVETIDKFGQQYHTSFLIGAAEFSQNKRYGSAIMLGRNQAIYHKIYLLPFGDYSVTTPKQNKSHRPLHHAEGSLSQPLMQLQNHLFNVMICYEILHETVVRRMLNQAEWLVVISNNNDFRGSIEPEQILQNARFYAKAAGREVLMTTNDGVSASIDTHGTIKSQLPKEQAGVLSTTVQAYLGLTPWGRWGSAPFLFIFTSILLLASFAKLYRTYHK